MSLTQTARNLRKNQTDAEKKLWQKLRNKGLNGYKFYRQYPIHPYYVDFVCRKERLVIELDGGQHNEDQTRQYDEKRTLYLKNKGYRILRFWNNDVLNNIEGVIQQIEKELSLTLPR